MARVRKIILLAYAVALAANVLVWGLVLARDAQAGHSFFLGNCWQPDVNYVCRSNWGDGLTLPVRLIDQYSTQYSWWGIPIAAARDAWNLAAGPQILAFTPQDRDTFVYLKPGTSGPFPNPIPVGAIGATNNCINGMVCNLYTGGNPILFSDIYLDLNHFGICDTPTCQVGLQSLTAHEFGHALLLDHHDDPARLMYPAPSLPGPTDPGDIGVRPSCSSVPEQGGIRCIYHWTIS